MYSARKGERRLDKKNEYKQKELKQKLKEEKRNFSGDIVLDTVIKTRGKRLV
jgi:hypothetical protein